MEVLLTRILQLSDRFCVGNASHGELKLGNAHYQLKFTIWNSRGMDLGPPIYICYVSFIHPPAGKAGHIISICPTVVNVVGD